ncbi:MAG: sporulation initiation factor Spo0A C-terminal domain-containing protein [Acutalibacteraceae bacterium]|nr:response regulator [Clostridia bacterium]MEE3449670.1 sporulation initiation factor Spo0A C-terminal domain-containing protein [Acutalibacteraceae bacterium]
MKQTLSVLLVDDDLTTCDRIKKIAESYDNIELIASVNNAQDAVNCIKEQKPDAMILDLKLHHGKGSGFDVLKEIKTLGLSSPFILITTFNTSSTTYEIARRLGADFIMYKKQEDYSEETPIDFLRMLSGEILQCEKNAKHLLTNKQTVHLNHYHEDEYAENEIDDLINEELIDIGINPKVPGFKYLKEAIKITISNPTHNISAYIGKKFNKSSGSVERAMQNAIERAWDLTDIDVLSKHYTARINSSKGVPTILEFIYFYANKINQIIR